MTRAAMIAAGTAGTMASLLDCGSSSSQPVPFYGVACSGSECVQGDQDSAPPLYDGGSGAVFYGVVCTGDACGPVGGEDAASAEDASDAGSDAADAQTGVSDAQADATDASDG